MRLGIPNLSLTSAPTVSGVVQSAGEIVARSMQSWYDAKDGGGQEIPNRNDGGADPMLLGRLNTVEATEDPAYVTSPRPLWRIDTAGQQLRLPASDIPTFTGTTGAATIVLVCAVPATNAATGLLVDGGNPAFRGLTLFTSAGSFFQATVRDGTTSITDTNGSGINDGVIRTYAGVANAGSLVAYNSRDGLGTTPVSYTAVTSPDFGQFTVCARSDGFAGSTSQADVVAVLYDPSPLTAQQLDDLAAFIEGGAYS